MISCSCKGLIFVIEDVEADDVIATISKLAGEGDFKTIIASSDKDLYQLVSENINQLDMKGKLYDAEKVEEKMGVEGQIQKYQIGRASCRERV